MDLVTLAGEFPNKTDFCLETIDWSKPRTFGQIVVKGGNFSGIHPASFPLGNIKVSKIPGSQLLGNFMIISTN